MCGAFDATHCPNGTLDRLIEAACLAPSIGLSQPWRFVIVDDPSRRSAIRRNFAICNADALAAQAPERAARYARLKLAGLEAAPSHTAIFVDRTSGQGHGLGRHTMPEMTEYSVMAAVHTFWLVARSEGIGMGWVSILDPSIVAETLQVPAGWTFIGYLCLGCPEVDDYTPAPEREGWEQRRTASAFILHLAPLKQVARSALLWIARASSKLLSRAHDCLGGTNAAIAKKYMPNLIRAPNYPCRGEPGCRSESVRNHSLMAECNHRA